MEVTANAGKYKIIEYLVNEVGYQAFVAVNIEKSTNDQVLINRYREANEVRRLVPIIYDIARAGGEEFVESFSEYGALCAVFTCRRGVCIHKALALKKQEDEVRLSLAKSLMHQALLQVPFPLLVRNAGLECENVLLDIPNRQVFFRRVIRPNAEEVFSNEQRILAQYLPILYKKNIFAPDAYWDFIEELQESSFVNMAEAFSAWCACAAALEQSIADMQKSGKFSKLIPALVRFVKRKIIRKRKRSLQRLPVDEDKNRNVSL